MVPSPAFFLCYFLFYLGHIRLSSSICFFLAEWSSWTGQVPGGIEPRDWDWRPEIRRANHVSMAHPLHGINILTLSIRKMLFQVIFLSVLIFRLMCSYIQLYSRYVIYFDKNLTKFTFCAQQKLTKICIFAMYRHNSLAIEIF